jgi:hypothetical protein
MSDDSEISKVLSKAGELRKAVGRFWTGINTAVRSLDVAEAAGTVGDRRFNRRAFGGWWLRLVA